MRIQTSDGKTKVAILGGGWFGQFHLDSLLSMEDVDVTAFATGNPERLAALSAKAPWACAYKNQRDLLENEPLDALVVAVPPDSHDGIEALAAQKKVNLYMEKPLGVDLKEVLENEKLILESKIISAVGYQTRYNPQVDVLRDRLSRDETGAVVAKWMGVMPETPWWRIKARSGGQFAEQVTHMVDLLRYLFGDVATVYAAGHRGLMRDVPHFDVEDASMTVLTFESGLLATVACGCFIESASCDSEIQIEIYGKENRFTYRWDAMSGWENKKESCFSRFGNEFHFRALRTFIEAVQRRDPSRVRSPYSDAVKTFKTTWAANLSMQTRAEVSLRSL
jgi:predicted dehydrogenase